jgi:hypothetical protein
MLVLRFLMVEVNRAELVRARPMPDRVARIKISQEFRRPGGLLISWSFV